jgi:putative membrane protein
LSLIAPILTGIVAVAHLWFLVLEMFLWARPFGRRTFGHSKAQAEATAVLAKNQGLYNGFLAAGLVWSLLIGDPEWARAVATFFLTCVVVAGLFGGATAARAILFVQALPAALALAAVWML